MREGDLVTHQIYGRGTLVRSEGKFAWVKFEKRLPSIMHGVRDNTICVGICALS